MVGTAAPRQNILTPAQLYFKTSRWVTLCFVHDSVLHLYKLNFVIMIHMFV